MRNSKATLNQAIKTFNLKPQDEKTPSIGTGVAVWMLCCNWLAYPVKRDRYCREPERGAGIRKVKRSRGKTRTIVSRWRLTAYAEHWLAHPVWRFIWTKSWSDEHNNQVSDTHFLLTRTLASPRSLRFFNFSCLLLSVSFPSPSSVGAAAEDLPKIIGPRNELQSL